MLKFKRNSRKESKIFLDGLENRFLKGEILSIRDLIEELSPESLRTPLAYLLAEKEMRGHMGSLKYRFKIQGFSFGVIDELGRYGIMNTPGKANHYLNRRYKLMKGVLKNSQFASAHAMRDGLLAKIENEKVSLPKGDEKV